MPPTRTTSSNATRSRRVATDKLSSRKRAPIACQFCRLRKTRCDGVKPICGFCQHHDAQCVWGTTPDNLEATKVEQSILQQLGEIKEMLHESRALTLTMQDYPVQVSPPPLQERQASPTATASQQPTSNSSDTVSNPFKHTRCESILAWPVFRDIVDTRDVAIESFVLECEGPDVNVDTGAINSSITATGTRKADRGIPKDQIVPLCRKFLTHVHVRNPILDAGQLIQYARRVAEHGPQWDSLSCLVLVACALACYTTPFERNDGSDALANDQDLEDAATAEIFYLAAKKRFGLLDWNIIDMQCLFFASVYEKYQLNPLQAWFHIQQASLRLQAHLKRIQRSRTTSADYDVSSNSDQQLQRLFWSVYKAEHEMLPELPFRSSGLEVFTRTDSMFPTIPSLRPVYDDRAIFDDYVEERSWAFYTAEISIRRTITDTILTLYRKGEDYWLAHAHSLIRHCQACETEIQTWYSHLPPSVHFDYTEEPKNELSFYLQGRFNQWRTLVSIPVLYYALHRTDAQVLTPEILNFAQQSVIVSVDTIVRSDRHNRHGGTWFCCRGTFLHALLILGVVLKADMNLVPPSNWNDIVVLSISTLRKWEAQSANIFKLRTMLEQMLVAVHRIVSTASSNIKPT